MKKNILLPTDFSDNAWNAVVYALKLYAEIECTFYFMHSIKNKIPTMANFSNKLKATLRGNAMKELLELKEMALNSNENPNHKFEIILSENHLHTAIMSAIVKYHIDLVVIGKKGTTGSNDIFFGGNTINTIKNVKGCPILIVPDEHDYEVPKEIAFPTDFNRFYDNKELKPLKDLVELNDSKIKIVHINVEPHLNEIQEYNHVMLKDYLKDYEHSFHWMPDYSTKADEISEFINDLKIHILVMINYKHSILENIINEPVIKKLGTRPVIPFLIIPD